VRNPAPILHELASGDLVGLERELEAARAPQLLELARRRGGLDVVPEDEPLRELYALLPEAVAARVIFDLGLVRTLGYYTGAVFEVYDAAFGAPLGGGGRYDDLLGRFGRPLPACGWALDVERIHAARLEEGR
jgi:ATP phosphoribosyltransferase regulatory subunit HisZ